MDITGKTVVTGVFGWPVRHSLSPVFQNAAFRHCGLDFVYIPLAVEPAGLRDAVEGIRAMNILGMNITIPHKKAVIHFLDGIDSEAEMLGAVNTISNVNGKLEGAITDGQGFIRSLTEDGNFRPEGERFFILGAGGSAYAISGSLAVAGAGSILICNRTYRKAEALKRHLQDNFGFTEVEAVRFEHRNDKAVWREQGVIVNTTSVGMQDEDPLLLDKENISQARFVYDIVYNRETRLIKVSRELGISNLNGFSMLLYQGAVSFAIWTGVEAPVDVMKKSLEPYGIFC